MLMRRTLWYLETHLSAGLSLTGVAAAMQVSPEYLTRASVTVLGRPLMTYARARRLSEAALVLAQGDTSVLCAALDAGYGAPEPFARAFRAEMGQTPRSVRASRTTRHLALTLPMELAMSTQRRLAAPTIETMPERRLMGPMRRYTQQNRAAIPGQWADYNAADVQVSGAVPDVWYGACTGVGTAGDFDYLCGQEVPKGPVPAGWSVMTLPTGRWARFVEPGHITLMQSAWSEIFTDWMGSPGLTPRPGPITEVYPLAFDGQTGEGGFEIWMPVE